jgi:hypothetical protein
LIAGNSHRVGQLIEIIKSDKNEPDTSDTETTVGNLNCGFQSGNTLPEANGKIIEPSDICLTTKNLSVMTPNRSRILIKNLNFQFEFNTNVLITGWNQLKLSHWSLNNRRVLFGQKKKVKVVRAKQLCSVAFAVCGHPMMGKSI